MRQLREFAQHTADFDSLNTQVVGISVDGQERACQVWETVVERKFTILSDPGARIIRQYGLLHEGGRQGEDIAIRASILIDERGIERWRRVSATVRDVPSAEEALAEVRRLARED